MSIRKFTIGPAVLSLVAGSLSLLPSTAGADTNPATSTMTVACDALPALTTGTQAGVPAVVPGETVTLRSAATFSTGTVYQAALTRPDGSRYFAAAIEVIPDNTAAFTPDVATLRLTQDGNPIGLVSGTEPQVGTFVLDTAAPVGTFRVYFPGDAAAMLADPQGYGLPSFTVESASTTLALAIDGVVNDDPASIAGLVIPVGGCQQSVSSGPSNRSEQEQFASVAITEPSITVSKTTSTPALAPDGLAHWKVTASSAARTDAGVLVAPARDVRVVDTLPAELTPVDSAGNALADGAATSSGGVWSSAARTLTWSIPTFDAGTTQTFEYSTRVDANLNPLDATVLSNNVNASYTSLPAADGGGRSYTAGPASSNVTIGIVPPQITKAASPERVGFGSVVTYTVDITIPASTAIDYSTTITDVLPAGLTFGSVLSTVCSTGCPGTDATPTTLPPYVDGTGATTWGVYLGNLEPATDRIYQVTYTATTAATASATINYGTTLTNTAAVSFDAQDRLGGAVPNTAALPTWDVSRSATAAVTLDRPTLTITKTLVTAPSPWDPNSDSVVFDLAITNTSVMEARNVQIQDSQPRDWLFYDGSIVADSGSTFYLSASAPNLIGTLDVVAAGSTVHITVPMSYRSGEQLGLPITYLNTARILEFTDTAGSVVNARPGSPYEIAPSSASVTPLVPHLTVTKSVAAVVATSSLVTYTVTVRNDSLATANGIEVADEFAMESDAQWDYIEGSLVGTGVSELWGSGSSMTFAVDNLAPNTSNTFTYQVMAPDHAVADQRNSATARWRDGGGHSGYEACSGFVCSYASFEAKGIAETDVVVPAMALQKGPDEESFVAASGTVVFTVDVTNPGSVALTNVVIDDAMPETLTYEAHTSSTTGGSFSMNVDASDPANPIFTIPTLPAGAALHLFITARQDGTAPSGTGTDRFQLVNTATATATEIPLPMTDTGSTLFVPNIQRPTVTKSVDPTVGKPGDTVTWDVTIDVPANIVDVYDVMVIDKIPDGLTDLTTSSSNCNSGPCAMPVQVGPAVPPVSPVTGDRSSYMGWWLGDVPANTAYSLTIHYTTRVEAALDDGTLVLDGQATEPLDNRVRGYYNTTDTYATETDVFGFLAAPNAKWNGRTVVASAALDIVTPNVTITKVMTTHDEWKWRNVAGDEITSYAASAGDALGYKITVCNIGSSTAYDTSFVDDMGLGDLQNVTIVPSAATIVDGWSAGDPLTRWSIASLAPSACEEITYTGTTLPSADLIPAYSGVNSDIAAIRNTATVEQWHTVPDAGLGDIVYGPRSAAPTTTLIMTPYTLIRGDCLAVERGLSGRFTAHYWTYAVQPVVWTPETAKGLDPSIGGLHDARVEMWLAPGMEFVPGSVRAAGQHMGSATQTPFRDPDSISTAPDGRTILRWNEAYLEYQTTQQYALELSIAAINRTASEVGQIPVGGHLSGVDGNGAAMRGEAQSADYIYLSENYGCLGRDLRISKRPNPVTPDWDVWKHFPDETFDYWGSWQGYDNANVDGHGEVSTAAVVTDTMPDGPTGYVPGSAQFTLYLMDGTTQTFTAADITETITSLPGGRTRITWTNWPTAHYRGDYRIPALTVPAARTDLLNTTLTNDIRIVDMIDWPGAEDGNCGVPMAITCDVAPIFVKGPTQVIVDKVVDDSTVHEWGSTRTWTVTTTVKAGSDLKEFTVIDDQAWSSAASSTFDPFADGAYVSASCVGCPVTDAAITTLPRTTNGNGHAMGWAMGDLAPAGTDRVYTLRYTTTSSPLSDAPATYLENEANKIRRFENSAYATSTATAVPPQYGVIAEGGNWWNAVHGAGVTCTQGGGCIQGEAVVKGIQLGFPWLSLTKDCLSTDSNSYDDVTPSPEYANNAHPLPPRNLPGQPNLTCSLVLTNTGGAPAVNFAVRDTPDPVGDATYGNPSDWPGTPTSVSWDVLQASGPFPASTTWADSNSAYVEWAAGPSDPLDAGESWNFDMTMHVDGWIADPNNPSYGRNVATLTSWTDELGNAIGSQQLRTEKMRFASPQIFIHKGILDEPTGTIATNSDIWDLRYRLRYPINGNSAAIRGATQTVALLADIANADQLSSLSISDALPSHTRYVAGSARLLHTVTLDPAFNTPATIEQISIGEPARNSADPDPCAPGARGETLTWNFSASAPGWESAPWSSEFGYLTQSQLTDLASYTPPEMLLVFDTVVIDDFFVGCTGPLVPGVPIASNRNYANMTATALNNESLMSNDETNLVAFDPLGIAKTPDAGALIAGQTDGFDLSVWDREFAVQGDFGPALYICAPPYTDPSTCTLMQGQWLSPLDPTNLVKRQHSTVTDVMTDYGLFDNTTEPITLTVIPPSPTGVAPIPMTLGTDYTQTVTRLDADHVQITWEIFNMPLPVVVLDSATWCYCAAPVGSVNIHIPLTAPAATDPDALPTGTVINNTASMTVINPDGPQGVVWPTTPIVVTDTGAMQIVTPSPPPTPVKIATPEQAVGGVVDYSVETRLPASQVWFDLAYTDVMPAGTEFVSTVSTTCEYADGGTCDAIPTQTGAPTVNADGTTNVGWWFGDVASSDRERIVTMNFRARLAEDAAHSAPLAPGDVVTNTVRGYSNNDNRIDDGTAPTSPIVSGDYQSSATASTTVIQPELTITKAADQLGPLSPDDTVSWTVTVHNSGNATAYGTEVTDTPNGAVTNVAESPSSGYLSKGWTAAAPQMAWFIPTIPAGGDVILTYQGVVGPNSISDGFVTADNTADIGRYRTEPAGTPKLRELAGPEADASVPLAAPRLTVAKWSGGCGANSDTATVIGKPITFCVRISNVGTRQAVAVEVADVLPANWTYVADSAQPFAPTYIVGADPQTLVWSLGYFGPDGYLDITYQAVPNEGASLSAKNLALVTSEMPSGNRAKSGTPGYSAETNTPVSILSAGLEIAKLPDFQRHGFLPNGGDVPFTIEVGANTSTDLNGTIVTDTLPAPLLYLPGTATSDCNNFTEIGASRMPTTTWIAWSIDLPAGTSCTITLPTQHPGGRSDEHRVLNHVEAVNPLVPLVANQALAEFYGKATLGDHVWNDTNRDGIQDAGEPAVAGVTVTLYSGVGAVVGTTTTDASGNYLFTDLEPGTYRVKFSNLPQGMAFTQVRIGTSEKDSDADPASGLTQPVTLNSGDVYLHLDAGITMPEADLAVAKRAVKAAITESGGTVTYAIDMSNAGPGEVQAPIVVTDVMPAGMTATAVIAPSGWTCLTQDQTVTCTRSISMAAGSAETIRVDTTLSAALASSDSIVNTVSATVKGIDATVNNNNATATVTHDALTTPPAAPTTSLAVPPVGALPRTGLDAETLWSIAILAITGGMVSSVFGETARRRRRMRIG